MTIEITPPHIVSDKASFFYYYYYYTDIENIHLYFYIYYFFYIRLKFDKIVQYLVLYLLWRIKIIQNNNNNNT